MSRETEEEMPRLTLDTIANGAVPELFKQELDRVLANILDPNTPAEAKRSLRIDITIEPNDDRTAARHFVEVSSKLAPFKGAAGVMFVGRRRGEPVAVVSNLQQTQLKWDAEGAPRALPSAAAASPTGS